MADNPSELEFQLTDADREKLKENSAFSLPDNPSDKEFSAAQIKKAMYYPSLMLFDWMKEGFESYDEKFIGYDEKFANKVDKLKTANKAYVTDSAGDDSSIEYSINVVNSAIAQRNNVGELLVPTSTTNNNAALSYLQFITEINRLDAEDVKIAGSTMTGNIKFNNGFGLYDRNNRVLISQLNDVNTVGNASSSLELKGSSIRTIDKTLQKYNSTTGTSENYALIGDVNTEKARAMAAENDIRDIAAGKSKSITISIVDNPDFDSEALELSYIGTIKDIDGVVYNQSQLKKGDEILVVETGKKDRWFGGTGKFYVLESDTSFLINYQKKLTPDSTITLDSLGNIKANLEFSKITGNVSDSAKLSAAFNVKQDKATSYNMNADSTKTVFYQTTPPVHAPTGALWINESAGVSISFQNILGSIKDNVTSDTYIKSLIQTATDRNIISTIETIRSGDLVQLKYLTVNLWTQVASYNTMNLPLANPTTAGLMSYEDYNTLIANTQKIAQLEGRLKRISYDAKDNPTANEIDAYVRGLGYVEADFPYLKVIVYGTKHMWIYYTKPTIRWQDDGIDSAGIFTNDVAGLIKGSSSDGKVYAESDGTGSVNGWDALKTRVTNTEASITSIQGDLPNYIQKTGGTFTGNINMGGHIINMVGGYVKNVKEGSGDDAVPKKWITAQLGNYLPKVGGTIDGDLSITGTLSVGTFELSSDLNAKAHKITNLGTPSSANDAANKDYVDLAIDDVDDLISDETEARTNADTAMMKVETSDPTSSSVGTLGQLWKNTSNGKLFKCDAISGGNYTWNALGIGEVTLDDLNKRILSLTTAPNASTVGVKGQLAFAKDTGKLYQCKSVSGTTYIWEEFLAGVIVEPDNKSIVKDSDNKFSVSFGGKFIGLSKTLLVGVTAGVSIATNIIKIISTAQCETTTFETGDYLKGEIKTSIGDITVDSKIRNIVIENADTHDIIFCIGTKISILPDPFKNLYICLIDGELCLATEADDVGTILSAVTSCNINAVEYSIEKIKVEVMPIDYKTIVENEDDKLEVGDISDRYVTRSYDAGTKPKIYGIDQAGKYKIYDFIPKVATVAEYEMYMNNNYYDIDTSNVIHGYIDGDYAKKGVQTTLKIIAAEGFKIPEEQTSITITNATFVSYDNETGEIVISDPTGEVSIECTCEEN